MKDPANTPSVVDPIDVLSGNGPRKEVAGCPTGLTDMTPLPAKEDEALQGAQPGTIASPGEGVNEDQQRRSGVPE